MVFISYFTSFGLQCSHEENFEFLHHDDHGATAVKVANPKTLEFQVVRTSLIPGLLKTIRENRSHALPVKIFETSDVVFKDPSRERQARNVRHAAAVWCNKTAGFEVVHGMLDRAMKMLEVPRIDSQDFKAETGYYIKESSGACLFPWFIPAPHPILIRISQTLLSFPDVLQLYITAHAHLSNPLLLSPETTAK
jgi:phenylalanyl-tRNA synthetase beta subunit